jgi:hypothetical protein
VEKSLGGYYVLSRVLVRGVGVVGGTIVVEEIAVVDGAVAASEVVDEATLRTLRHHQWRSSRLLV